MAAVLPVIFMYTLFELSEVVHSISISGVGTQPVLGLAQELQPYPEDHMILDRSPEVTQIAIPDDAVFNVRRR